MRKFISLLAAILLLSTMALTASAETGITMTDAVGQAGQQVSITVTLNEAIKGDSVAVVYSYDKNILSFQKQPASSWALKNGVGDFGKYKPDVGIWAPTAMGSVEMEGTLCTLVFRVNSGVSFDSTAVTCTVSISNGGKIVGEYTAQATVRTACSHSYGAWTSRDEISHTQTCTICKEEQVKTHTWDAGKQIQDPDNSANSLMVHTCAVCGGTRSFVLEGVYTPATQPEQTRPSTDQNRPSTEQNQPTIEQVQPPIEQTRPSNIQQDATVESTTPPIQQPPATSTPATDPFTGKPVTEPDHFHTEPTHNDHDYNDSDRVHPEATVPQNLPVEDDGHDHDHTTEPVDNTATPIIIAVAAAVLIGALVFFVKKKW